MRLFVSINPSPEIHEYLHGFQRELPEGEMTLPRDFHLTLKFLGEVDASLYRRIIEALSQTTVFFRQIQPFIVQLTKIAFFKQGRLISVIYVNLQAPKVMFELQQHLENAFSTMGFPPDQHRFVPHLTLARVKYYENGRMFEDSLKNIIVKPLKFKVTAFYLVESFLSREGARYEEREKFSLLKESSK